MGAVKCICICYCVYHHLKFVAQHRILNEKWFSTIVNCPCNNIGNTKLKKKVVHFQHFVLWKILFEATILLGLRSEFTSCKCLPGVFHLTSVVVCDLLPAACPKARWRSYEVPRSIIYSFGFVYSHWINHKGVHCNCLFCCKSIFMWVLHHSTSGM